MIITESNIDDMKYEVEQSIEKVGLVKTLKRYKFPIKLANIMFQLTRPFTSEECNQIISYYLLKLKYYQTLIKIKMLMLRFLVMMVLGGL